MAIAPHLHSLQHGLVVSCQAPVDSPLHDPSVMAAIAQAAVLRGAVGVRIDTPAHIQAVRQQVTVPIIGLWKCQIPGYDVYITPQFEQARAVAEAGADIVAIDATQRPRPGNETVADLIARIHQELGKPVMADIDTLDNAIAAATAGADLIGTTLYGYTQETRSLTPPGFALLADLVAHVQGCTLVCEGGIASPTMARQALDSGADVVVVGTAITGIDLQVGAYCRALGMASPLASP